MPDARFGATHRPGGGRIVGKLTAAVVASVIVLSWGLSLLPSLADAGPPGQVPGWQDPNNPGPPKPPDEPRRKINPAKTPKKSQSVPKESSKPKKEKSASKKETSGSKKEKSDQKK
jgi:hypothetical protein